MYNKKEMAAFLPEGYCKKFGAILRHYASVTTTSDESYTGPGYFPTLEET